MEFVAWFSHKYIMHGFLWVLHKDHHAKHNKKFERNDWFAFIFATPAIFLIFIGSLNSNSYLFSLGLGIAFYGIAYFLFHDVLYHKRLKLFREPRSHYFKAIVQAHYDHHIGKKNYGFLLMVPLKYFKRKN